MAYDRHTMLMLSWVAGIASQGLASLTPKHAALCYTISSRGMGTGITACGFGLENRALIPCSVLLRLLKGGMHTQDCVTSSTVHANSEHASRAPRLHDSVCFRMRKAQLRAALRGVGRGHQPQAVAARTPLADEPDQELAQRQRLGAHGGHGGFQSQVHAHLTTAHPDLNSTQIVLEGNPTLPFELMTLTSHLEVATPTDCAVGAGKRVGAHDLWWARCQVRVCVCCMRGDISETVHAPRGRRPVECRREGLAAPGPCGIHTVAHATGILACAGRLTFQERVLADSAQSATSDMCLGKFVLCLREHDYGLAGGLSKDSNLQRRQAQDWRRAHHISTDAWRCLVARLKRKRPRMTQPSLQCGVCCLRRLLRKYSLQAVN